MKRTYNEAFNRAECEKEQEIIRAFFAEATPPIVAPTSPKTETTETILDTAYVAQGIKPLSHYFLTEWLIGTTEVHVSQHSGKWSKIPKPIRPVNFISYTYRQSAAHTRQHQQAKPPHHATVSQRAHDQSTAESPQAQGQTPSR
ncbi:MAG: hypothetical protein K0R63_877 [Rickettsiales bacterium]|nr:hypothetical protein [Rickettsiales bacterium]